MTLYSSNPNIVEQPLYKLLEPVNQPREQAIPKAQDEVIPSMFEKRLLDSIRGLEPAPQGPSKKSTRAEPTQKSSIELGISRID